MNGVFFGRFQPYCVHHGQITRQILDSNPDVNLTLGIADWKGTPNRANFLTGQEASAIARLSLVDLGLNARTTLVELTPNLSLEQAILRTLQDTDASIVFSGSEKTLAACHYLSGKERSGLVVVDLHDEENGNRATNFRRSLLEGTFDWEQLVTSSVVSFFRNSPQLVNRLRALPDPETAQKRPWPSIEGPSYRERR